MRLAFCLASLLVASTALAQAGTGRVSVVGGWRYTPNDFLIHTASEQGIGIRQGSGGPQLTGSFAYAAAEGLEVAIDLFAGYEQLGVSGYKPISSVTYGALLGGRAYWRFGNLIPHLGVGLGPALVDVSGGVAGTLSERVVTTYAAMGGLTFQLNDNLGITADVRVLYARGYLQDVGGINAGGVWGGLGVTWFFPPDVSREGAVR